MDYLSDVLVVFLVLVVLVAVVDGAWRVIRGLARFTWRRVTTRRAAQESERLLVRPALRSLSEAEIRNARRALDSPARSPWRFPYATIEVEGWDTGLLAQHVHVDRDERTAAIGELIAPLAVCNNFIAAFQNVEDRWRAPLVTITCSGERLQLNRFQLTAHGGSVLSEEMQVVFALMAVFQDAVELAAVGSEDE